MLLPWRFQCFQPKIISIYADRVVFFSTEVSWKYLAVINNLIDDCNILLNWIDQNLNYSEVAAN